MNWTECRHRMLALVAQGDTVKMHCVSDRTAKWKYRRTDRNIVSSPEARALGELNRAHATSVISQARSYFAPRPVELTKRGEALLAEWNQKHGEVEL